MRRRRELFETAGENVTVTKHGFESRWGHHGDVVVIFAPKFSSPGGRDVNPFFTPRRCRTLPTPAAFPASPAAGFFAAAALQLAGTLALFVATDSAEPRAIASSKQ